MLNLSWSSKARQWRSPNVIYLLKRSDWLAFWCATAITSEEKLSDRALLLEAFLRIAEELHAMHDFNSLMGVMVGLNNSAIVRLKKTWALVPQKLLQVSRFLFVVLFFVSFSLYASPITESKKFSVPKAPLPSIANTSPPSPLLSFPSSVSIFLISH